MTPSRMLLAWSLWAALPALTRAQQPAVDPVSVGIVAEKLGVKAMVSSPRELDLGHSVTTILADPKKLVAYGIPGMHEGARVTITCVGPNRVRVEAEEMEPVDHRATVTLRVGDDGTLTPIPPPPPPPKNDKPPMM